MSDDSAPYVIAEIGVNHEGSLDLARRLIDLAKAGGADAAKFQTYKAEKLASRHSPSYWDTTKEPTRTQFELFQKYDRFGDGEYAALAEHCCKVGIDFISTPFDRDAVDFLAPLVPFFKIASADITNVPLLRQVAGKGKPVVVATGCSTYDEINAAVATLEQAGASAIVLLHCILNYPTLDQNAHLGMITGLRKNYPDHVIGYSDHTLPDPEMVALTTAYLLGARVIEKHFTHDKTLPGNDHYHAMDGADLACFIERVKRVRDLLGPSDFKQPVDTEASARENSRRSLVLARRVRKGETLTEDSLIPKRPGTGISPAHWDEIIGRRVNCDLDEDTLLQWSHLDSRA